MLQGKNNRVMTPSTRAAKQRSHPNPPPNAAASTEARNRGSGRQALLVLGMHRNGTSALTRVLNLLGADLPGNLLGPTFSNEAGHWESSDLLAIHDELLSSVGSSWDDWRRFDPEWYSSPAAETYKLRLLNQLQQDFGSSRLFVIKDPRICRFVPLWLDVLERFGAEPHVIIPIRNPIEVAESLARRDGFSLGKSYLVWLRHVLDAEAATRNLPRAVVTYDSLIGNWRQVVTAISEQAKLQWPERSQQTEAEIDGFLVAQLRHHVVEPSEVAVRADIVDWVKKAYRILHEAADKRDSKEQQQELDNICAEFEMASAAFSDVTAEDMEQLRKENTRISEELTKQVGQLSGELKSAQALAAELAADLALTRQLLDELRESMKSLISYVTAGPAGAEPGGALGAVSRFYWSVLQRTKSYRRWQYDAIQASQSFDAQWYLARYPDIAAAGHDPLRHFVRYGAKERRIAHPSLDPESKERRIPLPSLEAESYAPSEPEMTVPKPTTATNE